MKSFKACLLAAALLVVAAGSHSAQTPDLGGTWVGDTVVPNSQEKDIVTLVLKKDGASYTGTLSDSMGMAVSVPLEKVKIEKGTLTFEFVVQTGEQPMRIYTTLKISGEKLIGSWTSEDNSTGNLEMTRKK
jgi:hypothetical protein